MNEKISKMLCKRDDTLLACMRVINTNAKGIVFVIDEERKLCGVVTDGDIRRALLEGKDLQLKVGEILKNNYVYADYDESETEMLNKFNGKINIIPLVNERMEVQDFLECAASIRIPVAKPELSGNEFKYAVEALLSTWISSNGKYIPEFEKKFAEYCETEYGVAVSNGTVALHLALVALGIGKDDEVIVPDLTFAATINSVLQANATPVIVDVEQDSWCIDPNEIEKAITPKTKAIMPVHIYGQPCDMDKIMAIAKKYNLYVIEDCAEAHGAKYNGKKVGSFGDVGCFSFFANKVITTGEGGMCTTKSEFLAEKMRILRDHGMSKSKKYYHEVVGYNYRMTNIQAAIGLAQLERIDALLLQRELLEDMYNEELSEIKSVVLQSRNIDKRYKINWLISILVQPEKRDFTIEILRGDGIEARPFFYPLSKMDIYKKYTFSNKNSLEISKCGLNLPTSVDMKKESVIKIKKVMQQIF